MENQQIVMKQGKANSKLAVFCGGTATNNIHNAFSVAHNVSYIMPISDNGGSSSEILRVLGGPAIGDIRSRLIRLMETESEQQEALKAFLSHRLPDDEKTAREEWYRFIDGTDEHDLMKRMDEDKRTIIRIHLIHLQAELAKVQTPRSSFSFSNAAIGNLFLTSLRLTYTHLEPAISLLKSLADIPDRFQVLPIIYRTRKTHHIAVELENGSVIVGQNQISHPSPDATNGALAEFKKQPRRKDSLLPFVDEDAQSPYSHPALKQSSIKFSKHTEQPLAANIARMYYIQDDGREVSPQASPKVLDALEGADCIVYSIGSLYTSIIASLLPRGIGKTIRLSEAKHKVLLLNNSLDRETGPKRMDALDFVKTYVKTLCPEGKWVAKDAKLYVTDLVYLDGGEIRVDVEELGTLGIRCIKLPGSMYDEQALNVVLASMLE